MMIWVVHRSGSKLIIEGSLSETHQDLSVVKLTWVFISRLHFHKLQSETISVKVSLQKAYIDHSDWSRHSFYIVENTFKFSKKKFAF